MDLLKPPGRNCPKCGKFVGNVMAEVNCEMGLGPVEGFCIDHGYVDISDQGWTYDDFDPEAN